MFRNYLAAALRNLVRNRLYTAVNIIGLAVGFTAAIFAALFVRNELTYDKWIPGHERTYVVATAYAFTPGGTLEEHIRAHRDAADWLKRDYPQVEVAARLGAQGEMIVRHGDVRTAERLISWADPEIFSAIPLSAIAGDLRTALNQPDGIVLTRAMARKYFGRDTPIGEIIELNQQPLQVAAVIEDWPPNTAFDSQAFISALAPFSRSRRVDVGRTNEADPNVMIGFGSNVFVRLKTRAAIDAIASDFPEFVARHMPSAFGEVKMRLLPLSARHLDPTINPYSVPARARLWASIYSVNGIGLLIILAAAINFVNATTARSNRRGVEVGVRKVTGAARRQLVFQFMGESLAYVVLAMIVAIILALLLLPALQGLIGRGVTFAPWRDWELAAGILGLTLTTGAAAGIYPAFILASLRPAAVLKAKLFKANGSGVVRQSLVVLQFAVLIGVAVVTIVTYRQTAFAMNEGLRFDKDQVLWIQNACTDVMKSEVQALPGVRAVACGAGVGDGGYYAAAFGPDGASLRGIQDAVFAAVDYGLFELIGLKPLAGRFFDRDHSEDAISADGSSNPSIVVNESTVRKLGFTSPAEAVGQIIAWQRMASAVAPGTVAAVSKTTPLLPSRIIGVVADYSTMSKTPVYTRIYYVDPAVGRTLNVKLTGRNIPETLQEIDGLWAKVGDPNRPIQREFIEQRLEYLYRDMKQQTQAVAVFAAIALFIAALGLFGLSAFTAERRTKEIGIRKAMGAREMDVLRLLLWQFTKPVLWANVIAWPTAYMFLRHWLEGFAYHIDLSPWMFLAASALALIIATATVAGHALLVARAQPVTALRYE